MFLDVRSNAPYSDCLGICSRCRRQLVELIFVGKSSRLFRFLKMVITSPLCSLCSCVISFILLFLSSGLMVLALSISFVALFCTFSSLRISPFYCRFQSSRQYSIFGRMYVLYAFLTHFRLLEVKFLQEISIYIFQVWLAASPCPPGHETRDLRIS